MASSEDDSADLDDREGNGDICRVCRMEASPDRPLFYPCLCTGSIKYIHQECLLQWLKYSKKEICELCNYKFTFQPSGLVYASDMPRRLPVRDVVVGVVRGVGRALRCWLVYTIVVLSWLGVVPLTASRVYRAVFAGSVASLVTLPLELLSTENVLVDILQGTFIISIFLCTFICLVWLREQIIHGGPQHVLQLDAVPVDAPADAPVDPPAEADSEGEADDAAPDEAAAAPQQAAPEENNWLDWERGADDLTWERLLGLDGSFVFLEHIFWVVSLNTFFTLVFAFSPYHVGRLAAESLQLSVAFRATRFEGVLSALFGYLIICVVVFVLHKLARLFRLGLVHRATGMCFLVLKVFLLVVVEIGLFPLACGCWLDVCSLSLFSSTQASRLKAFAAAPATSLFVHWLVGMVYVFYFASFVLVLREVLRPGLLWFLRNLNDPEFNPIQEMIQLPVARHIRRLAASSILFSATVLLVVYVPIQMIRLAIPSVLPYNISLTAETPLSELSLEVLLLQVILPALLEQSHARAALKALIRGWCTVVGRLLQLTAYLLPADVNAIVMDEARGVGGEANDEQRPPPRVDAAGGLAAEHQALLLAREPVGFQPYHRAHCFALRMVALCCCLTLSSVVCSAICFTAPVVIGRIVVFALTGQERVHELYTISCGLYICWLLLKMTYLLYKWIPRGWSTVVDGMKYWGLIVAKCTLAAVGVVGLLPYLLGTCFQLTVITPLRVGREQTPLFFPWQDWAMGVLHCKIVCAFVMMGPDWWLKQVFERLYQDGFRNLRLRYVYGALVWPVTACIGSVIVLPYVTARLFIPAIGGSLEDAMVFQRYSYAALVLLVLVVAFVVWQFRAVASLAAKIRNDKYLVGQQLVNYERKPVVVADELANGS